MKFSVVRGSNYTSLVDFYLDYIGYDAISVFGNVDSGGNPNISI
jgi:hypothetical protein